MIMVFVMSMNLAREALLTQSFSITTTALTLIARAPLDKLKPEPPRKDDVFADLQLSLSPSSPCPSLPSPREDG